MLWFFCLIFSCCRIGGVSKEVPSLLVQVCQHVPHLGVLSLLAEDQACSLLDCHGPICRPRHYHLHCPQHPLHGNGALPHDSPIWGCLVHWQLGEKLQFTFSFVEPLPLVSISVCFLKERAVEQGTGLVYEMQEENGQATKVMYLWTE